MEITKGYVETPNGQLHYRRSYPSSVQSIPLLLVHQRPSSSSMWEPVMPLFSHLGFDTIAIDLPGYGASYRPLDKDELSLSSFARVVMHAISQLGYGNEKINIVGHHTGAAIAMQAAVDFPDFEDEELKDVIRFWKIRPNFVGKPGYKMPTKIRIARLIELLECKDEAGPMDVENLIPHVKQPTLCMYGHKEILKDQTIRTAEDLLHGQLFVIPDAGIDVQDEFPEEFTKAVANFILNN